MWRKNRRDNLDGEFGVDLNRNYGEQWGLDNIGSSPLTSRWYIPWNFRFQWAGNTGHENFTNNHEFKLALNYHTYGNFHIVPWGYGTNFYTPDSTQFDFMLSRSPSTITSWLVHRTKQWTTPWMEIPMTGCTAIRLYAIKFSRWLLRWEKAAMVFGLRQNRIVDLCKGSMYSNITLARLAGVYGTIHHPGRTYITSLNSNFISISKEKVSTPADPSVFLLFRFLQIFFPLVIRQFFPACPCSRLFPDSISITLNSSTSPGDEVRFVILSYNGLSLKQIL